MHLDLFSTREPSDSNCSRAQLWGKTKVFGEWPNSIAFPAGLVDFNLIWFTVGWDLPSYGNLWCDANTVSACGIVSWGNQNGKFTFRSPFIPTELNFTALGSVPSVPAVLGKHLRVSSEHRSKSDTHMVRAKQTYFPVLLCQSSSGLLSSSCD